MRSAFILVCAVFLASCATAPKTVSEFREAMIKRPAFSKQEVHDISRDFSSVVNDVKRKSTECLQFGFRTTTQWGSNVSQTTSVFRPRVQVVGVGKAEMTMQMERQPKSSNAPEGGAYVFLADIGRATPAKTRITMYGTSFPTWQPIFDAIKGWSEGKNIKCPDTP